jgi:hypothetical protein
MIAVSIPRLHGLLQRRKALLESRSLRSNPRRLTTTVSPVAELPNVGRSLRCPGYRYEWCWTRPQRLDCRYRQRCVFGSDVVIASSGVAQGAQISILRHWPCSTRTRPRSYPPADGGALRRGRWTLYGEADGHRSVNSWVRSTSVSKNSSLIRRSGLGLSKTMRMICLPGSAARQPGPSLAAKAIACMASAHRSRHRSHCRIHPRRRSGHPLGCAALSFVGRFAIRGAVGKVLVGMLTLTGSHERGVKEFENRS